MKRSLTLWAGACAASLALVLPLMLSAQTPEATDDTQAADELHEVSYTLGFVVAHRLAEAGIEVDADDFVAGFRATRGDQPPKLSPDRMQQIMDELLAARRAATDEEAQPDEAPDADAGEGEGEPSAAQREAERLREAARRRGADGGQAQQDRGMYLNLDGRVPGQRIDTAVPATREATFEADNPDAARDRR